MKIKEEETTFLLKRTTFKEKKTGVVFGCFCWKWGARGDIFADEKPTDFLPTNLTNFRASECRTELVRVMPSAAENVKEIYTNTMCFENGDLFGRTNFHEFNEGG